MRPSDSACVEKRTGGLCYGNTEGGPEFVSDRTAGPVPEMLAKIRQSKNSTNRPRKRN